MDDARFVKDACENLSWGEMREIRRAQAIELIEKADYFMVAGCITDNGGVVEGDTIASPFNKKMLELFYHKFIDWIFLNMNLRDDIVIKNPE